jgi:hypothetical protein
LPVPPEGYGLQGVETTSPASAWASAETGSGRLLRWNGKAWISVSIAGGAWLTGVSGVSADNVWAVGNFEGYGSGKGAAIYHWNGKAWTRSA